MRIVHILDHALPAHSGYVFRTMGIVGAQEARGGDLVHRDAVEAPERP